MARGGCKFAAFATLLVGLLASGIASADDREPVTLHADDIEYGVASGSGSETLGLRGNVVITFGDRPATDGDAATTPLWTLRADSLEVKRDRFGVALKGRTHLAFCPCLDAPLRIDVDAATVSPPSDLFLRNATVRIWSIPVFYTPWAWLRAPDRFGVLPPDVAFRGRDGLRLGLGVNVPLAAGKFRGIPDPDAPRVTILGGGYTAGGAYGDVALLAHAGTLHAVVESRGGGGITLDGSLRHAAAATTLLVTTDARIGPRALRLEPDLSRAASLWNRTEFSMTRPVAEGAFFGVVTKLRSGRGGDEGKPLGVLETVFAGGLHGRSGGASITLVPSFFTGDVASTALSRTTATPFLRGRGAIDGGAFLGGPLAGVRVEGQARAMAFLVGDGGASVSHTERVEARAALPLGRHLGAYRARLDPEVAAGALAAAANPGLAGEFLQASSALAAASPGRVAAAYLRAQLAFSVGDGAGAIQVRGGGVAVPVQTAGAPLGAPFVGAAADRRLLGLRAFATRLPAGGAVFEGGIRLGTLENAHLSLTGTHVAGDLSGALVRAVADRDAFFVPLRSSTLAGRAGIPLPVSGRTRLLAQLFAASDLSRGELLAVGAGLRASDACGCLTIDLRAQQRLGRDGIAGAGIGTGSSVDAFLAIQLAR
jgi:hypothetical protein